MELHRKLFYQRWLRDFNDRRHSAPVLLSAIRAFMQENDLHVSRLLFRELEQAVSSRDYMKVPWLSRAIIVESYTHEEWRFWVVLLVIGCLALSALLIF